MRLAWAPAVILCLGAVLSLGVEQQRNMSLVRPLHEVVPMEIAGYLGSDLTVSEAEAQVAGFSNHLLRLYQKPDSSYADPVPETQSGFSVYVGFYEFQARGSTIHSPKNCLPGAGWEALSSEPYDVDLGGETVTVNRYVLQNEGERAIVLYWYQGRGRIAHDEYKVKFDLLRDAAFRRRSDEALVRIVSPVGPEGEEAATVLAAEAASEVAPRLELALPGL